MLLEIPLNYSSGVLYIQLSEHLEKMIVAGSISSGERLPGARELARMLRVSRSTVASAYALLAEKGLVIQSERKGTYVSSADAVEEPEYGSDDCLMRFDSESPTADLLPVLEFSEITKNLQPPFFNSAMEGSPPEGQPALRRHLLQHSALRGIPAHAAELVVTSGGKDALSTALRSFRELDVRRLWAEELSYGGIAGIARNESLVLRTLPLIDECSLSRLEGLTPSDVLYLVPSFHNPTGRTMPHGLRERILSMRGRLGFHILEDDSYGELRYGEQPIPALKSMDDGAGVAYIGSFSQALFPGMRLGYALLPSPFREAYLRISSLRQGHVSSLVQAIVTRFLEEGRLPVAVEKVRRVLSGRMEALYRSLRRCFPAARVDRPEGGAYLWFPTGRTDGEDAAALAKAYGVCVSPGVEFALGRKRPHAVRFSIIAVPESIMPEAAARLQKAWRGLAC